jgi:hypothetical protein
MLLLVADADGEQALEAISEAGRAPVDPDTVTPSEDPP